jgi:carboxylesterase
MADQRFADTAIRAGAETIDLQEGGSRGVLLLHGFGDTPQTLSLLARRLHKAGYNVLVPLLPGHGRTMKAFRESTAEQWIAAATESLSEITRRNSEISVVGLSMGGALGVLLAAKAKDITALALIAPYLGMPFQVKAAAATHWLWGRLVRELSAGNPCSIRNPIEREMNLAYGAVTGRVLFELSKVVRAARKALPLVTVPTLVVQSREDPRISAQIAESAFKVLGAQEKRMVWTEGAGHIITVDYGRERVFNEVQSWLDAHANHEATAARK